MVEHLVDDVVIENQMHVEVGQALFQSPLGVLEVSSASRSRRPIPNDWGRHPFHVFFIAADPHGIRAVQQPPSKRKAR